MNEFNLVQVERIVLGDGREYSGWGYFDEDGDFIPHGRGKKFYKDFFSNGNFIRGKEDGPVLANHGHYMYTAFMKNSRAQGWGLCINGGMLIEFGYYHSSQLSENLLEFVEWYYQKMIDSGRNENMLSVYSHNDTHLVTEILIGYKGEVVSENVAKCFMGFRFKADGSVWVGNTATRALTGKLLHFRPDGHIDAGEFVKGELVKRVDLQSLIDDYYGTWSFDEDDEFSSFLNGLFSSQKSKTTLDREAKRERFRDIASIDPYYDYSMEDIF